MPDGAHRRGVLGAKGIVAVASLCLSLRHASAAARRGVVVAPFDITPTGAVDAARASFKGSTLEPLAAFVLRAGLEPAEWPPCSVLGISRHLRPQFSTSNASFYDVQDLRGCTCTHREPPPRAQTPPNTTHRCCNEAVRVRAPERARSRGRGHLGRHGALAASETVKRDDAFAAPSRRRVRRGAVTRAFAGPPTQIQDRAGHADFGAGIKFQAPHAIDATLSP